MGGSPEDVCEQQCRRRTEGSLRTEKALTVLTEELKGQCGWSSGQGLGKDFPLSDIQSPRKGSGSPPKWGNVFGKDNGTVWLKT